MNDRPGFAARLLAWYDCHRRVLPWRALPGAGGVQTAADPYRVWLSEIMLQQTVVATVKPYFEAFVARWPTVQALAAARLDEVLAAWAGLGYYSRARNLHACAQAVVTGGGVFPNTAKALEALPGIGGYTGAAIASIAFGEAATVVDGNVERVVARIFKVETPLPLAKPELKRLAATLTPQYRPGDYAQAMMDLGATVCVPRNPKCIICPVVDPCAARAAGVQGELPRRAPKQARPTRQGIAYWLTAGDRVLLRQRPARGLLGGMLEVPSGDWIDVAKGDPEMGQGEPLTADWQESGLSITHVFTHFALELQIVTAQLPRLPKPSDSGGPTLSPPYLWATVAEMETLALPSVMRKIIDKMQSQSAHAA